MLDLSIIIVNWNTSDLLRQCIESINETTKDLEYEIIVVDNGSSDGSPQMVKENFPRVILILNEDNLGFAKANNIGMSKSTGRYIALINFDIIVLDNCLDSLVGFLDKNKDTGMAGPRLLFPDMSFQTSCRRLPSYYSLFGQAFGIDKIFPRLRSHMTYKEQQRRREVEVMAGGFIVLRREAVDEVGTLDESFFFYGEDVDWCKRFKTSHWKVVYFPESQAIHIGGASARKDPLRYHAEINKSSLIYWKKHHGRIGYFSYLSVGFVKNVLRLIAWSMVHSLRLSPKKVSSKKVKQYVFLTKWFMNLKELPR